MSITSQAGLWLCGNNKTLGVISVIHSEVDESHTLYITFAFAKKSDSHFM